MNSFQANCIAIANKTAEEIGLTLDFMPIQGKRENYLLAKMTFQNIPVELYVYDDEAGIMLGSKWFICERQDFTSDEQILAAFDRLLKNKLQ